MWGPEKNDGAGMPKFYVVWSGRRRGIFDTWDACQESIRGFPGARFKSFGSRLRAESELGGIALTPAELGDGMALTVDGACSGALGEYRGVVLPARSEVFRRGPFCHATNNTMEYLAIVDGLRWMDGLGLRVPLYSDSRTAMAWVAAAERACRTARAPPPDSEIARELARARNWLRSRVHAGELVACVRKWDTRALGEIPADFGRK
jgi:ribonuclease HI